jgi:hypothetical protein
LAIVEMRLDDLRDRHHVGRVRHVDPDPDHVLEPGTRLGERLLDVGDRLLGLRDRALGVAAGLEVGADRAAHEHEAAVDHRARIARQLLVFRARIDVPARHGLSH